MDSALHSGEKMADTVVLRLARKDLLLLILVLDLVARSHANGGSLGRDIEKLQAQLGRYWSATDTFGAKLAEGAVRRG